jgi:hypothetical protein
MPEELRYRTVVRSLCSKTELCRRFQQGLCRKEDCRFAHATHELRERRDLTAIGLCRRHLRKRPCVDPGCAFHLDLRLRQDLQQRVPDDESRQLLLGLQREMLADLRQDLGYNDESLAGLAKPNRGASYHEYDGDDTTVSSHEYSYGGSTSSER